MTGKYALPEVENITIYEAGPYYDRYCPECGGEAFTFIGFSEDTSTMVFECLICGSRWAEHEKRMIQPLLI